MSRGKLTCRKPKNARVKRALAKQEPLLVENEKTAIFVRGSSTSQRVRDCMQDMVSSRFYKTHILCW